MNIAYIAAANIPSSTANSVQVMKVCQALTQLGHEVRLFVPGRFETDWDELANQYGLETRFTVNHLPSRKTLKRFDFVLAALRRAKAEKAEVIYTRMLWVAVAAQLQKFPVILELHDLPAGRLGNPLFKRYLRSDTRKMTVLITKALGRMIEERLSVKLFGHDCVIAPDGVDDSRYASLPDSASARRKLGLAEKPTAVYTGGFYQGRGLELLLKLARDFPHVQFLWVGGKPEAVTAWKAILKQEGVENTTLTGFVSNAVLPLYQAAADVLLMPFGKTIAGSSGGNTAEVCSPLKMFEYMAAGRAILTSDLPVLREVLNESNACFYLLEDYDDLQDKFSGLLNDPGRRKALADAALNDVKKYTWQERMRRIMQAFIEET
jgi:glycosyltransferase involved in cell wall biosynthesis